MQTTGYIYTASAGETFDSAARTLYGNEKYAAELLAVNPEYSHKLNFAGGEKLYLPVIDIPEDDDSDAMPAAAPWRE